MGVKGWDKCQWQWLDSFASLRVYNAREHPKYKNGEWTEKEVFEEFLKSFEPDPTKDGKVTKKEFLEYYACLGSNIDNDAYFDLMVRNAWKI